MEVHKVQHTSGDGCVQQWEGILGPIHILVASIVQEQYIYGLRPIITYIDPQLTMAEMVHSEDPK